jgi:hypothetical protein
MAAFQVILKPTDNSALTTQVVGADGVLVGTRVVASAPAVPSAAVIDVLQALVNITVTLTANQRLGLIGYIAAIELGTDTSDVEIAIGGL